MLNNNLVENFNVSIGLNKNKRQGKGIVIKNGSEILIEANTFENLETAIEAENAERLIMRNNDIK